MRPNFSSVLLLVTLLMTLSCSQKGSSVKLEISHNFAFGNSSALQAIAGGGLMVWGKSSSGDAFAQTLEGSDDLNLQLTKGSWTFYAMAWDGSKQFDGTTDSSNSTVFGGVVRCAKSLPVVLSGSPASVDLNLNNGTCTDTDFAGTVPTTNSGGNVYLAPTQFTFCRGLGQIVDGTKLCTDTKNETRQAERKAWIASYKVKMKTFKVVNGAKVESVPLSSKCVEMLGDAESTPAAGDIAANYGGSLTKIPGLPAGGAGIPFAIELEMFPGNPKCDVVADGAEGIRGSITRPFPNGIVSDLPIANKYFGTATLHKQYINIPSEAICNGRNGTSIGDHPFAAGDGSSQHPYIICSVPQFHSINNDMNYLANHYKQEANLDFNPYSQGLAGTGVVPSQFACLELGANFIPLGYYSTTCAGAGSPLAWGTLQNFTGTYSGGGYKISNLRLRDKNKGQLGLFASINGNAEVGNLIIENVEIEGKDTIGLLAGIGQGAASATSMQFWNITASKLDIQARDESATNSMVGGIFGRLDKATLTRVIVKDSRVRGVASKIGGVIGYGSLVNLKEVTAEADIDANSSVMSKMYVGGVVGQAEDMNMDYVKHEGAIYTNATKVGGILGAALNTSNLTNFYAISHVTTNDSSPSNYLGGVVGYWGSVGGSNFGPGYTLSIVKSDCMSACQQGQVAGTVATQPGTQQTIYHLSAGETGAGGSAASFTSQASVGSLASMRMAASVTALPSAGFANWNIVNGEYPRFDFENHPCTMVIAGVPVSGSGAGSLMSPKVICNEDQYLNLTNMAANTYHKLAGNIRLSQLNTSQYDMPTFSAVLDGNNRMLLGGYAQVSGAISPVGHIGTIASTAIIKNLRVHGMGRESNDNTTTHANAHGVFAGVNNGKIYGSEFSTYGKFTRGGALVVGTNGATGEIRNVKVDGRLQGYYADFAPFAIVNNGLIEASKTNSQLDCIEGAGCNYFAGLVVENNGTIKRSQMGARLNNTMGPANYASMIVDSNTGLIEDVLVSQWAEFKVSNDPVYFHRINSSTGILRRVINNGKLISDNSFNYSPALSGYPDTTTAVSADLGTHVDVFRSGGRSGKLLFKEVPFNCSNADQVLITGWGGMTDYNNWNSALSGTGYETLGYKFMVELEFNDGTKKTQRILDYNSANYEFAVNTGSCPATTNGKASLWYTEDLAMDITGTALAGSNFPQDASVYGNYSAAFQGVMWDSSNATHEAQKLAYYAFLLGVTTTPSVPRIWELEDDEGLRLFEVD